MEGMITEKIVKNIIRRREREIHKGDCGRVLIVAGSRGMAGAAVLCGRAALRAGAGLVRLAIPQELFPIIQISVPEATCVERSLLQSEDLAAYDAIAAGPGLGESKESVEIVKMILESYEGSLILDADGLNVTAHHDLFSLVKKRRGATIITPHVGEAKRLLGEDFARILQEAEKKNGKDDRRQMQEPQVRKALAAALVKKTGAVSVLKGAGSIVAIDEDVTYTNTTGNPGMATGGSGDVLTGILAGLSGQGIPADQAALAGVWLHGKAGDLGAEKLGEYGLTAGDLPLYTAYAIREILKGSV